MALTFRKDQVFTNGASSGAGDGYAVIYEIKEALKAAGWTVKSSGTGTSGSYNSTGDSLTTRTLVNTVAAWFRIQDPGTTREYVFQRSSTAGSYNLWRIKYSAAAKFTGGSPAAAVTPSATDEVVLIGGGTDASPTFQQWGSAGTSTYRTHVVADNATPYAWIAITHVNGATTTESIMFMDQIANPASGDPDPVVLGQYYGSNSGNILNNLSTEDWPLGIGAGGAHMKATVSSTSFGYLTGIPFLVTNGGAGSTGVAVNLPVDAWDGKDNTYPLIWSRRGLNTQNGGVKGRGTLIRLCSRLRVTGDTLTVSTTKDRYIFNELNIPWDGSTPTL